MHGRFAMVRETLAQDPAYRPAHSSYGVLTCVKSLVSRLDRSSADPSRGDSI
jgi:hypothetical protein